MCRKDTAMQKLTKQTILTENPSEARRPASMRWAMIAAALWIPLISAAPVQACSGKALVTRAGAAFTAAARSRSASAFAGALRSHANMPSIALFALGKYRRKLPSNRKAEYVRLTSSYVARTLADFSRKFRASEVKIVNCRGNKVETKLIQLGGRPPQRVVWRVSGGKVADVNVQNVWLAQLLRNNFTSVIQKGGGNINVLFSHLGGNPGRKAKSDR